MSKSNFNTYPIRIITQQIAPRTMPVYAPGRVEARERVRARALNPQNSSVPRWMIFTALVLITFAFCVVLNVRSRSEMRLEQQQNGILNGEIKQLQEANTALAEEIHNLQTDPATIERAARQRLYMVRANEQRILVPNN
ncbi:MAG: septum formation initiator family protein [Pyrinomonadaceae bacterium]